MTRNGGRCRAWMLAVGLSMAAGALLGAQAAPAPAFEVVSVKPNDSGAPGSSSLVMAGGRYLATNATLRTMIRTAWQVHDDQIIGGPDWIGVDRFDLTAKAAGNPPLQGFIVQARLMLRSALADRFKLVLQPERREIPVYALVLGRSDGRTGPQLTRTDPASCAGPPRAISVAPGAPEPSEPSPCDSAFSRPAHLSGRGRDASTLVAQIAQWADRVIVDRTGLTGQFDWDLQWTIEPRSPEPAAAPTTGVPFVTAVQEQLGLKLEPQRAPVDVLVIRRVERFTPD
jgi:uncharacterized protein (TIGR03435 family)